MSCTDWICRLPEALAQSIPEPVPGTWPPSAEALGSPSTVASTCEQVGQGEWAEWAQKCREKGLCSHGFYRDFEHHGFYRDFEHQSFLTRWSRCCHCWSPDSFVIVVQELDMSPCSPTSPGHKSQAEAELLERKTTVMRLQNRLQKIFAKQLTPGKSVWCWRYEKNEVDHTFQASVHISLLDRSFTGGWAATHQAAQMEACNQLAAFLDKDFKVWAPNWPAQRWDMMSRHRFARKMFDIGVEGPMQMHARKRA